MLVCAFLNLLGFTMAGPITPALGHHFGMDVGASLGMLTSAYPLGMLLGDYHPAAAVWELVVIVEKLTLIGFLALLDPGSWLPASAVGAPLATFSELIKKGTLPGQSLGQSKGDSLKALPAADDPWEFFPWFDDRLSDGAAPRGATTPPPSSAGSAARSRNAPRAAASRPRRA